MTSDLRRRLTPIKPLLRPVWHALQPVVSRDQPWSIPTVARRLRDAGHDTLQRIAGHPPPPIRPLKNHEIVALGAAEPYYRPRRVYLSAAGDVARDLIERRGLRSALELGPHLRPLIVGADVMDVVDRSALQAEGRRVIHDATVAPWPFADKSYDLFVALQVFEHLGDRQPEAFREVRRIARNAVVSLPIDWVMADPANCHHRLSNERALSWFAPVLPTRIVVGNGGHRKRLLYVFEDLPSPGDPEPAGTRGAAPPVAGADGGIRPG